jgi:hypothetical protein
LHLYLEYALYYSRNNGESGYHWRYSTTLEVVLP